MRFVSQFGKLREAAVKAAPASAGRKKEEREQSLRDLLRWLLVVPLVLLLLFGCATLGMIGIAPASADTRSYLEADYSPWIFEIFQPINPEIIEEIQADQELYPETFVDPVLPTIMPAAFWPSPTPTPSPTPGPTNIPSPTSIPSKTPTPTTTFLASAPATTSATPSVTTTETATATSTSTATPTITFTPTLSPTNTPVPPTNIPTNTATNTPTNTPVPPTSTPTNTPVPPTNTATNTPTNTPVPPTNTPTNTATNTPTNTPVPPSNTPTNTATNTPTNTSVPPTNTPTSTPPPTSTLTPTPGTVTVNSGTCSIAGGSLSASCTISPVLTVTTKTFMVFQATSSNNTPNSSNVRCVLASTTAITCDRFGTTGTVNIRWQTVEFASGVTVEHLTPACVGDITNVAITPVADMARTFLVYSHAQGGVSQDANDRRTVRLTTTSNVEIRQSGFGSCAPEGTANALQVVQFTNTSVTRGLTGAMTGTTLSVSGLPAVNTSKTMLIYSYRTSNGGANIAAGLVRGRIDSTTSLSFTRGDLSGQIDAIAWERIEFTDTSTVQQIDVSMAAGVGTANTTISSVDTSRTIAFAGGQWTSGQGFGETSYAADDVIGVAVGRHELTSATNLLVTRDDTNGTADWTSSVVEFAP